MVLRSHFNFWNFISRISGLAAILRQIASNHLRPFFVGQEHQIDFTHILEHGIGLRMISILRAEQGNELESCHVGEGSVDVGLLGK